MPDHNEGRNEVVNGDNDIRNPGDRIGRDRTDIAVKPAEEIPVPVSGEGQPVRINDFVEDVRLDLISDPDGQLERDPAQEISHRQAESGRPERHNDQNPEALGVIPGDDIDHELAGDR